MSFINVTSFSVFHTEATVINLSVGLLFGEIFEVDREAIQIPKTKLRHLIQISTANRLRCASGPVLPSARYITLKQLFEFQDVSEQRCTSNIREVEDDLQKIMRSTRQKPEEQVMGCS